MRMKKNHHCDFITIDNLLELQENLNLFDNQLVKFCGLKSVQQLRNWKKKGRVPAVRFWAMQNELAKFFKKEYDRKTDMIWKITDEEKEKVE